MVVRLAVADVSSIGRNTQGVRLVNLKDEDRLVAVEIVRGEDLARFDSGGDEDAPDGEEGAGEAPEAGTGPPPTPRRPPTPPTTRRSDR